MEHEPGTKLDLDPAPTFAEFVALLEKLSDEELGQIAAIVQRWLDHGDIDE